MKYKIMIVDDEPVNLRTLERVFRQDYHVVTAESGAEALSLLEQHEVALMISDQRMPEMTGIELMKNTVALRPQMVKLLLTGYTDISALIEAINCGLVYRYLTKPWNNDDLRLTVTRALEHYEMMKSKHRLGMENQRLRALLDGIGELVTEGMAQVTAAPQTANAELDIPQAEEVYELLG
jgi:DNA-binding NtrC family response regulator